MVGYKIIKLVVTVLIVIIFVFIILSVLYLFNGSFELYPTDEQTGKINLSMVSLITMFVIIEIFLFVIRKRTKIK